MLLSIAVQPVYLVSVSLFHNPDTQYWVSHWQCILLGIADGMVGMNVGESRQIKITLPDDFEPEGLRGVDVICSVAVSEIFQYDLAEVGPGILLCGMLLAGWSTCSILFTEHLCYFSFLPLQSWVQQPGTKPD